MKSRLTRFLIVTVVCVALSAAPVGPGIVGAQDNDAKAVESEHFELQPKFPVMTGPVDATFEFQVGIVYRGEKSRVFDLNVSGPEGWLAYVAESTYEKDKQLSAIHLEEESLTEEILVVAAAPYWDYPEPQEYSVEVEAISEDRELEDSIDLSAEIEPQYELSAETGTGRDSATATAGEGTAVPLLLSNSGTAALDSVDLSALEPDGAGEWHVEFEPSSVEALGPGDEREVGATITPPEDAVPGDYRVSLNFETEPSLTSEPPSVDVRVTVAGSSVWGWVLVVAVVMVAAAVAFYMRSKRFRATE